MNLIEDCFEVVWGDFWLYGGIGFLVGLILVVFLAKINLLFSKEKKKVLDRFYAIYLIVLFATFVGVWQGTNTAQQFLSNQVRVNVIPMNKLLFPTYQYFLVGNWKKIIQHKMTFSQTINNYLKVAKFDRQGENLYEKVKINIANDMMPRMAYWGISSIVKVVEKHESKSNSTNSSLNTVRNINIYGYPNSYWDEVEILVKQELDNYFNYYYSNLLLIFVFLFGPVFTAIIIRPFRKGS